jgi:hypothetical protein
MYISAFLPKRIQGSSGVEESQNSMEYSVRRNAKANTSQKEKKRKEKRETTCTKEQGKERIAPLQLTEESKKKETNKIDGKR